MRRTPPGSTAVLVAGVLGGLKLFQRRAPGPFHEGCTVSDPCELRTCLDTLPGPRTVILCDGRHRELVASTVLSIADLYVVPAAWFRDIHPWDVAERADRAGALVTAHRQRPIEHLLGGRQLELLLPF